MKSKLKKILKSTLSEELYIKFRKIYTLVTTKKLFNLKYILYDQKNDKIYNENIINKLRIDSKKINQVLNEQNLDSDHEDLSWHYHLFAGLKTKFCSEGIEIKNILEIGTDKGTFTKFLSNIFPESKIYSIDLNEENKNFINYFMRKNPRILKSLLKERELNLKNKNIFFEKLNSIEIVNKFKENKFDLIWIDGDHLAPQVTIDIVNCIRVGKLNSLICVDDIIFEKDFKETDFISNEYISNESFKTLEKLTLQKFLETNYLLKRVRKSNAITKKYISISRILRKI